MSLRNLLKHKNSIYGVLAIWIILFHINRRLGEPVQLPVLSQLLTCGNMAVDVFMFLSGCCLYLSMDKKTDVRDFYKRRILRLLPSYLIITVPFWFWRSLIEAPMADGGFYFIRFFADLSSATFWLSGIETTWFVHAIFVFYLLFPLIYKVVKRGIYGVVLLLVTVYAVNIIAIELIPFYDHSSIAWTRLPVFILGIIAGKYIDAIDLGRLKTRTRILFVGGILLVLIASLIVFPIGSMFTGNDIKSEYLWLLYAPLALMLLIVLMFILGECQEGRYKCLEIVGGMSLELYMTHITILHWFTYYGLLGKFGLWTFLVIPVIAFLWSMVVKRVIGVWQVRKVGNKDVINKRYDL